MRPAIYYYLAQAWPADGHGPIRPGALPGAANRRSHTRAQAPHSHARRELPSLARRVLAALSGTSHAA